MLTFETEARVCTSCFAGDLEPNVALKGFYRKMKMHRVDSKCSHCGHTVIGEWHYEEVKSYLDLIEEAIAILRNEYYYEKAIEDVSARVADSLLSDDDENSPYMKQQYRHVQNLLSHFRQQQKVPV